jgi:iron(III) transport system substrate-binding protein
VVAGFAALTPGVTVRTFRAPTGQLAARIAADERSGGIDADLIWLSDPISMQPLEQEGRLLAWTPVAWAGLQDAYRTSAAFGTRILDMVIVAHQGLALMPSDWADLIDPAYADGVAFPDPAFAGSSLGVLGYFAATSGYGLDFYRRLKAAGAVQVQSPGDVVTGVAQGRYAVGITLAEAARTAISAGSPVVTVWPASGAIAVISPIAVVAASRQRAAAQAFVDYVLSAAGQRQIGRTGWQPIRPGSGGPLPGGPQVQPDWSRLYGQQAQLLQEYRAIFGG